jgi:hypothetical protein
MIKHLTKFVNGVLTRMARSSARRAAKRAAKKDSATRQVLRMHIMDITHGRGSERYSR